MIHKKLFIAMMAGILFSGSAGAADAESKRALGASLSADLVSSYIWRGQDCGGVSIQPAATLSYGNVSLGAWGSSGFDKDDTKEVDFTLGYSWKGLNISFTDYWFSNGPKYFKYGAHNTAHVWEAHAGYDFGCVALNWYTNIGGNDGVTSSGKRAYSSYVEVSAPFTISSLDFAAEVGASPYATSYYNCNGFAVTNIALGAAKSFSLTDTSALKVYAKAVANPRNSQTYLLAGVSFTAF